MSASYSARVLSSAADILAEVSACEPSAIPTAFQSAPWLRAIYEQLSPALGATPLAFSMHVTGSNELAMLLPLVVRSEGALRVASFPGLGVSDYGAPILGPAAPADGVSAQALLSTIKRALDADLLRLSSMPWMIEGRPNPLALLPGAHTSRHSTNRLTIAGTIEEFLHDRGKKYRKEVERCFRLLAKEGDPALCHAASAHEIASSYLVLQTQQAARHHDKGSDYALDAPAYSEFYERLLRDGTGQGFAHIFKLSAGDELVATLLGVTHGGVFTLLRISNGGARWQHLSPGRLIVIEVMRHFVEKGVRTFDMGIGDYAFKRGFGIEPEPLADLVAPLTWRAAPHAAIHRGKAFVRNSPRLKGLAGHLRGRAT